MTHHEITPAERVALAEAVEKIRIEIELAHGAELDAIAARLGVPPRPAIMELTGAPMESDQAYRRRVLHRAGF